MKLNSAPKEIRSIKYLYWKRRKVSNQQFKFSSQGNRKMKRNINPKKSERIKRQVRDTQKTEQNSKKKKKKEIGNCILESIKLIYL